MKLSPEAQQDLSRAIENLLALPADASFKARMAAVGLDPAVDMRGANLRNLDVSEQDLTGIDFSHCDCRGTHWYHADIAGCRFTGASLDPWAIFLAKNAHLAIF